MSFGIVALAGSALIGASAAKSASKTAAAASTAAAETQAEAADRGVEEIRRQFDATQELMAPYVKAGTDGLGQLTTLLGFNGADARAEALAQIEADPEFLALTRQGEEAILSNASATGGLRGGNTQNALAQFRPAMLSQLINERFSRLGGITQLGQAAAAGQAAAGQNAGQSVAGLLQQSGAAIAGGQIAAGQAAAQGRLGAAQSVTGLLDTFSMLKLMKKIP